MRIAYSCAGEGYGHAARMVALYGSLKSRHSVDLFVPDTIKDFVRGRLPDASIWNLPCFELAKQGNSINYLTTAGMALKNLGAIVPAIQRLADTLKKRRCAVVVSDFDPFLPYAARLAGIPVVQMNHPGIVISHVSLNPTSWVAACAARLLEGPYDRRIIISFYNGTVGPVLRTALHQYPVCDKGFIAVNLKKEVRAQVVPILDAIPGLQYKLYPEPGANFDEGLTSCSAVLSGAGHQTISEALCLGKPILALPQKGQYEQTLNATMLEKTGKGTYCSIEQLANRLPKFISQLEAYRRPRILPEKFCLHDSREDLLLQLEKCFAELAPEQQAPLARALSS